MMENKVDLVFLPSREFSQIQHVNPDLEDQCRIQKFEGDGQIWDLVVVVDRIWEIWEREIIWVLGGRRW